MKKKVKINKSQLKRDLKIKELQAKYLSSVRDLGFHSYHVEISTHQIKELNKRIEELLKRKSPEKI